MFPLVEIFREVLDAWYGVRPLVILLLVLVAVYFALLFGGVAYCRLKFGPNWCDEP